MSANCSKVPLVERRFVNALALMLATTFYVADCSTAIASTNRHSTSLFKVGPGATDSPIATPSESSSDFSTPVATPSGLATSILVPIAAPSPIKIIKGTIKSRLIANHLYQLIVTSNAKSLPFTIVASKLGSKSFKVNGITYPSGYGQVSLKGNLAGYSLKLYFLT